MDIPISSTFKQKTTKAVFSIVAFILVYILLLALAAGLTAVCIAGGYMIIAAKPMFFTIIAGLGLASIGILILIFLVKFLFKKHKVDLSSYVEIFPEDQPKLFSLLEGIVNEVGTHFPKKVYVSHEVNASVFYNSSFWSMFFPIKKNLHIGMGLVNTVSEEELKAILSHEFGHFSQKSMKVGSYVYNVNQIIFNMLYDNESYNNLITSWANVNNYFAFFANIAVKIVGVIQSVLRKMYDVVNKSYMELSREMEFHADAVAATITGYMPLKTSLLRMDLADRSYRDVIDFYNSKFDEALVSTNIFEEQSFVLHFLATKDKLPMEHNLPMVSETSSKFKKSKLVIGNQWASHPENQERIAALEALNIVKPAVTTSSANQLFIKVTELQERLTRFLFADVAYPKERVVCSLLDFKSSYQKEYESNTFNDAYKGYYDGKNPLHFNLTEAPENGEDLSFDILFGEEKIDLVYEYIALEQDSNLLKSIGDAATEINTFDYEGVKYKSNDAPSLNKKCESEMKALEAMILENDKNIYSFFRSKAKHKGCVSELDTMYRDFFDYDAIYEARFSVYTELLNGLHFTNRKTDFATIKANFKSLLEYEKTLKTDVLKMLAEPIYKSEITTSMRENFENYLSKDWSYFDGEHYNETSLKMFFDAINAFHYLNIRGYFLIKKRLVDFQIGLV